MANYSLFPLFVKVSWFLSMLRNFYNLNIS